MSERDRPAPEFSLDDLRRMARQYKDAGSWPELPCPAEAAADADDVDRDVEAEVELVCAVLDAMTPAERRDPSIIDAVARLRIATAAGVDPLDVAELLRQFESLTRAMKRIAARATSESGLLRSARRRPRRRPRPAPEADASWLTPRERDLRLWDFVAED